MANKRMFAKTIIDSDAFLDMPATTQALYFHFVMRADDEGFIGNPKKIMRMIGAGEDDFKILAAKRYVLTFESGVVVIKHWLIHNTIQMDRFNPTTYKKEKDSLSLNEFKAYTDRKQTVNVPITQSNLIKSNLIKSKLDMSSNEDAFNQFWIAYPKKELKKKSQEIWKRKRLDSYLGVILEFITAAQKTDRWKKGYIKQPPAFLNGECWNDELSTYNDKSSGKSVAVIN